MEASSHLDVTLALIAGGRALRLGGIPKGLLRLEGQTFLARQLAFRSLFRDVLLVTHQPGVYAQLGLRTVSDVIEQRGAPGGVHAGLVHARTPWVFALAADMPFVTRPVLELLLRAREPGVDAVLFEVEGRLEPLLACYRTCLAEQWGRALETGPSFGRLLRSFRVRTLGPDALREVDPALRSLVSINRPEDMERFGIGFRDAAPRMR